MIKNHRSTVILACILLVLSTCSLFIGVLDMTPEALLRREFETIDIFLISRLPRLLAILCTGMGMSVWPV